jgi:hypothetical protein
MRNIKMLVGPAGSERCHGKGKQTKVELHLTDIRLDFQSIHKEGKGKGKAVPLQAWGGPEGSRKLSFPDFLTMAQDSGKVVSLTHRPHLHPGNTPGTHFC